MPGVVYQARLPDTGDWMTTISWASTFWTIWPNIAMPTTAAPATSTARMRLTVMVFPSCDLGPCTPAIDVPAPDSRVLDSDDPSDLPPEPRGGLHAADARGAEMNAED